MKTSAVSNSCLTYEQLQSYASGTSDSKESAELNKHISSCKLCSYAVSGFSAVPFTRKDVSAINNQIDIQAKTSYSKQKNLLTIYIATGLIMLILGVFWFANSSSKKDPKTTSLEKHSPAIVKVQQVENAIPSIENNVEEKEQKQENGTVNKLPKNTVAIAVEPIKNMIINTITTPLTPAEGVLQPGNNTDITYFYDLKVADYTNLYFKPNGGQINFGKHTPSVNENKETTNSETSVSNDKIITLVNVLKKGLDYYSKGKYNKSISEFQVLLENNPADINALFYSALAYSQTDNYNLAIQNFTAVLSSPNSVFHPEAKWNLALINIITNEKKVAKQLLDEIVNEKGFYSKAAEEKLKAMK